MKLFLNALKAVVIFYWVIAAGLFSSMLFFPSAIDGLYSGYTGFVELTGGAVIDDSEPVEQLEWVSEEVALYEQTPEFLTEPVVGDKYVLSDDDRDLFYTLFVYEELATPAVCEDDPLTEEVECEVVTVLEWVEYPVLLSLEPVVDALPGDMYYNLISGELHTLVVVVVDPLPSEEVVSGPLSREEFVDELETLLIYSVVVMGPFTLLVFSLGKRYSEYVASPKETKVKAEKSVKQKEKVAKQKSKVDKQLAKIKSIGVTGLKIKK